MIQTRQRQVTCTGPYNYLLFLPEDYEKQEQWPTIIFLHGAGEGGSDLEKLKSHGVPKMVEQWPDFPFIAISPQCPAGQYWSVEDLSLLLDKALVTYRIKLSRIYLTGLSRGGYGTWKWAITQPERFAAIVPVCGGGDPSQVGRITHIPVWAFHGAKDDVVPLQESIKMVEALKVAGGNVQLTIYPEAGHDSWTETYNNPELFNWFLQHHR